MNTTTTTKKCPECGAVVWDVATVDQRLNKCWMCGLRFMDDTNDDFCPRCMVPLTETDIEAEFCTNCGKDLSPPRRVPCSFPGCARLTTIDPVYDDLCYEHVRADNE